jgi:hypothetical protein
MQLTFSYHWKLCDQSAIPTESDAVLEHHLEGRILAALSARKDENFEMLDVATDDDPGWMYLEMERGDATPQV